MQQQLKAGDVKTYEVAGKTLKVAPIPYGQLKKLLKLMAEATDRGKKGDVDVLSIPALMEQYGDQVIQLLFTKSDHEFLTTEWADANLTVPLLKEIFQTALVVNGLDSFFPKAAAMGGAPAAEVRTLQEETPNPGSITSSGSPTDGGPKTLTN